MKKNVNPTLGFTLLTSYKTEVHGDTTY